MLITWHTALRCLPVVLPVVCSLLLFNPRCSLTLVARLPSRCCRYPEPFWTRFDCLACGVLITEHCWCPNLNTRRFHYLTLRWTFPFTLLIVVPLLFDDIIRLYDALLLVVRWLPYVMIDVERFCGWRLTRYPLLICDACRYRYRVWFGYVRCRWLLRSNLLLLFRWYRWTFPLRYWYLVGIAVDCPLFPCYGYRWRYTLPVGIPGRFVNALVVDAVRRCHLLPANCCLLMVLPLRDVYLPRYPDDVCEPPRACYRCWCRCRCGYDALPLPLLLCRDWCPDCYCCRHCCWHWHLPRWRILILFLADYPVVRYPYLVDPVVTLTLLPWNFRTLTVVTVGVHCHERCTLFPALMVGVLVTC